MKIKNKLFAFLLGSSVVSLPLLSVVSCKQEDENIKMTYNFQLPNRDILELSEDGDGVRIAQRNPSSKAEGYFGLEEKKLRKYMQDTLMPIIQKHIKLSNYADNYLLPSDKSISVDEGFLDKTFELDLIDVNNNNKLYKIKIKFKKYAPYQVTYDKSSIYFKQGLSDAERMGILNNMNTIPLRMTYNFETFLVNEDGSEKSITNMSPTMNVSNFYVSKFQPLLTQFLVQPSYSHMKKLSINWEDPAIANRTFRGEVVRVSDGDTADVVALETKTLASGVEIVKGERYSIRYSGIDTPEKKVDKLNSAPFELGFALLSSKFGEGVLFAKDRNSEFYNVKNEVRVGFVNGRDSFNRIVGDIFFGEGFQYSYNTEITRYGLTLPYNGLEEGWKIQYDSTVPNYANTIYPKIALAFREAMVNRSGFFHYLETPEQIESYVYINKQNNKWRIFDELGKSLENKSESNSENTANNNSSN
ncbi:thermonuclease family protein [Mycoplasma sp. 4079]|uniref:thermonuclease family protein n=1 Tax=Mycoplasma sp. 4079 TaxID=3398615 RepID=UPI0039FC62F9